MKKIIALVLALVMILSLGTVASAKKNPVPKAVASVVANMLEMPANYLANYMLRNQNQIVNSVNTVLPAAYYGLEYSATAIDSAVQLGAKVTEARIMIAGSLVKGTTNLVSKALESIKVDAGSSAETSINSMVEDTTALGEAVYAAAKTATQKINVAAKVVKEVAATAFAEDIDEIAEELGKVFDKKWSVDNDLGDLTVNEFVVPDAWKEAVKELSKKTEDVMQDGLSFAASYVNKYIPKIAVLIKDPANFTDDGPVAQFIYKTLNSLFK